MTIREVSTNTKPTSEFTRPEELAPARLAVDKVIIFKYTNASMRLTMNSLYMVTDSQAMIIREVKTMFIAIKLFVVPPSELKENTM